MKLFTSTRPQILPLFASIWHVQLSGAYMVCPWPKTYTSERRHGGYLTKGYYNAYFGYNLREFGYLPKLLLIYDSNKDLVGVMARISFSHFGTVMRLEMHLRPLLRDIIQRNRVFPAHVCASSKPRKSTHWSWAPPTQNSWIITTPTHGLSKKSL